MSVAVAAGPYTVDSDLSYAPLAALLDNAADERPDVLILVSAPETELESESNHADSASPQMGPFVDAEHPMIKAGDIDVLPEELFRNQISNRLARLLAASPRTNVILVPSGRDLTNTHSAYPQSPFMKEGMSLPKVRLARGSLSL